MAALRLLCPAGPKIHLCFTRAQPLMIRCTKPIVQNLRLVSNTPPTLLPRQRISTSAVHPLRVTLTPQRSVPKTTKRSFTPSRTPRNRSGFRDPNSLIWATIFLCLLGFGYQYYSRIEAVREPRVDEVTKGDIIRPLAFVLQNLTLTLQNVREGRWWTMVTYSFMHFEPWHFTVNTLGLLSIGPNFVANFGPVVFVLTWLGSAVCGAGVSLWWERRETQKNPGLLKESTRYIGASGSILGLLTIDACMAPMQRAIIIPLTPAFPQIWVLAGIAGFSLASLMNGWLSNIGHAGHLGGMGFGALCYFMRLGMTPRFSRF